MLQVEVRLIYRLHDRIVDIGILNLYPPHHILILPIEFKIFGNIILIFRKEFDLPDNLEPINILVIGYGNEEVADTERHEHLRIPLTDLVSYEKL